MFSTCVHTRTGPARFAGILLELGEISISRDRMSTSEHIYCTGITRAAGSIPAIGPSVEFFATVPAHLDYSNSAFKFNPSEVLKNLSRGGATGCVCGGHPTRQQIGKLLSQSAKLDWLKITTEKNKIDFMNN
jgi:hypothetical protein